MKKKQVLMSQNIAIDGVDKEQETSDYDDDNNEDDINHACNQTCPLCQQQD